LLVTRKLAHDQRSTTTQLASMLSKPVALAEFADASDSRRLRIRFDCARLMSIWAALPIETEVFALRYRVSYGVHPAGGRAVERRRGRGRGGPVEPTA